MTFELMFTFTRGSISPEAETVDSKAVVEQQKKVDEVRREMLASHLEMRKQAEAILTPEQKKQLRQMGPMWAVPPHE